MRRAAILLPSAADCGLAAILFVWSVAPRSPGGDLTLAAPSTGGSPAATVAFASTPLAAPVPVPAPSAADASPAAAERPHDGAMAAGTPPTPAPTVEVAIDATAPAPAAAAVPTLVPATVAASPAKAVESADSNGDVTVGQKNREFSTKTARVKTGGTVKFVNDDTVAHNIIVTLPGGKLRNTGVQEPGQSTSMQFSEPGKYDVECAIHPQMKMTVEAQ